MKHISAPRLILFAVQPDLLSSARKVCVAGFSSLDSVSAVQSHHNPAEPASQPASQPARTAHAGCFPHISPAAFLH